MNEPPITDHLAAWRVASLGDREILEGIVAPQHDPTSPELARALAAWDAEGGAHYWDAYRGVRWLVLVREHTPPKERWWRPALLFVLTLVTTTTAGAALAGLTLGVGHFSAAALRAGLGFSIPLAAILLAHESGHYVAARRLKVDASPPNFIPMPSMWSLIGTMGAFIRIRSPIYDRRTLFDIGVAGPLAGAVVAIPVLLAGIALSVWTPVAPMPLAHQFVLIDGAVFYFGDSLLFTLLRMPFGVPGTLQLHPAAVAGWVGLLVTSFNLLPLAQLDGAHILHAMSDRAQRVGAVFVWLALLVLGMLWFGWWIWAALALAVGRGRLTHPPVLAPERPLDQRRMIIGWLAVALFILTFAPVPLATP